MDIFDISHVVANKRILLHKTITVRAAMAVQNHCWLRDKTSTDVYARSIVLECPGLANELSHPPTGSNPRIGGPLAPYGFDEVEVSGVLRRSPYPEFEAMLTDLTSVTLIGYEGRRIPITLTAVDKPPIT
ncbi:MAG: hypothetical protein JWP89_3057 [Schlesneria sp.]|nr:hypothetical protein [Schlesneria sp.]